MDWEPESEVGFEDQAGAANAKRWVSHAGHAPGTATATDGPHSRRRKWSWGGALAVGMSSSSPSPGLVVLDGSAGEGGGQILRTALTLSLLTGRPFRLKNVRANRDKPGLRPQHLTAVLAAAELGGAQVKGAEVRSRDLTFRPGAYTPSDLSFDIGTAGATALVLQTLHLPLALRSDRPVRLTLTGGTFNTRAPSFPFMETTWRAHMAALGAPLALAMPAAGFYPRGGGRLDAWIEPARLRPLTLENRGRLVRVTGLAGVSNLPPTVAGRMRARVESRLAGLGVGVAIALIPDWPSSGPGAAVALTAEFEGAPASTFVDLGELGKPSEVVADGAVDELLAHLGAGEGAAVDAHSADQILVPLALAEGRSEYTVSSVTEHLRTNALTIASFLERTITIAEPSDGLPGRVTVA